MSKNINPILPLAILLILFAFAFQYGLLFVLCASVFLSRLKHRGTEDTEEIKIKIEIKNVCVFEALTLRVRVTGAKGF